MPFSLNSIPAADRSQAQIKQHLDMYNETQDIWLIHNPDEQDYAFFYNRAFEPNPYIVPGCNKDIGFGKGNLEIRFFLAKKYAEKKMEQMIDAISKADWEKKKANYRLEERGTMEERLALRTNNRQLQEKILPQLLIGRVRRATEEIGMGDVQFEKPVDPSLSPVEQIMERLKLKDKDIFSAHVAQQEEMSEEDKKKSDLLASII